MLGERVRGTVVSNIDPLKSGRFGQMWVGRGRLREIGGGDTYRKFGRFEDEWLGAADSEWNEVTTGGEALAPRHAVGGPYFRYVTVLSVSGRTYIPAPMTDPVHSPRCAASGRRTR